MSEHPEHGWVPVGWRPPAAPSTTQLRLVRLGPEHHPSDFAAWGSSIDHIRATPGFHPGERGSDSWPYEMPEEANLADLVRHAREFDAGEAFAYTVLAPDSDTVIGCVYINPDRSGAADAQVRCWVSADHAALDTVLADTVRTWLATSWPLEHVRFPGR